MTDSATATANTDLGSPATGFGSPGYRAYVLGALLIVYVFNFIDRTIINTLRRYRR